MAKEPDSVTHTRDRRAQIKDDYEQEEREHQVAKNKEAHVEEDRKRKMQNEENQLLAQHATLVHQDDTREMLLQRIRDMREDIPTELKPVGHTTDFQKSILEIEQNAGRERVAKAEKEMEVGREARRKAEEETRKREGTMDTVHQPNPGMNEQFPTQNATLGKRK
jgi:hypothetical protein